MKKYESHGEARTRLYAIYCKHETGIRSPGHFKIIRGYERELKQPARALFPDIFID